MAVTNRDIVRTVKGGPAQRVVATYSSYADAQEAVDTLADRGFPVEKIAVVGQGLRLVERVTGRFGYAQAALQGGVPAAVFGALFGWLFGLFDWIDPLRSSLFLAVYGALIGLAVGALFGLFAHWLVRGERDFSSVTGLQADQYDLLAEEDFADEAERLLAGLEPTGEAAG